MSDELFIEVPVTRRANVTRIGVLGAGGVVTSGERLDAGDVVALMSCGSWRRGLRRVVASGKLDLRGIIGPAEGDVLYRVEPE